MGRASRDKGQRRERELVARFRGIGIHAERVPLSGAAGGAYSGDIDAYLAGKDEAPLVGELKARASGEGFVTLERWLGNNDFIALHRDRAAPLVVLPWRTVARLFGPNTEAENQVKQEDGE